MCGSFFLIISPSPCVHSFSFLRGCMFYERGERRSKTWEKGCFFWTQRSWSWRIPHWFSVGFGIYVYALSIPIRPRSAWARLVTVGCAGRRMGLDDYDQIWVLSWIRLIRWPDDPFKNSSPWCSGRMIKKIDKKERKRAGPAWQDWWTDHMQCEWRRY